MIARFFNERGGSAGRRGAPSRRRPAIALIVALTTLGLAALAFASPMQSTKLGPRLCETNGGGRFVSIPDFPGERIDRRLLTDIHWLEKRYRIFVTDGYSMDDVHAENGEHPIGLALDIVPNRAAGGRWGDIDRLARWAEPRQGHPRMPFRWVGYNGDAGHGRGNHLHLSWSHSVTRPGRPASVVDTIRCPVPADSTAPPPPTEPPTEPAPPPPPPSGGATSSQAQHGSRDDAGGRDGRRGGRDDDGRRGGRHHGDRDEGARDEGARDEGARGHAGGIGRGTRGGPVSGGLSLKRLAPVVVETDGVGANDLR